MRQTKSKKIIYILLIPAACASLLSLSWCGRYERFDEMPEKAPEAMISTTVQPSPEPPPTPVRPTQPQPDPEPAIQTEPEPEPEPEPTPEPWEIFSPHFTAETDPFGEYFNYRYAVLENKEIVDEYLNPEPIFFGMPETYAKTESITTFRGNNFRNDPVHGYAKITEEKLAEKYRLGTSSLDHWTGVGWSGQPAIVKWDYELQQKMNMLPGKKEKEGLVEVIQGAVDGYVYFFDLEDGERTRQPFRYGEPIKGGVSVDPRGYPILFIGQGDQFSGRTGFGLFSLIDYKELFFLANHDPFSLRYHDLFDSNPLFDIPNDRLFECGENGLIYNIKLNTEFDSEAGTISLSPEIVRYRYKTTINEKRDLGTEGSSAAFMNYIFTADNGGLVQCVDLMTFTPVWARDCTDDTDTAIVLDWEEETQTLALYTGCQTDYQGVSYLRKLNAENGDLLWEHSYPCLTDRAVSGGLLATPVIGRGDMSKLVVFWVGKVSGKGGGGALVAFDKVSGDIVWEKIMPSYGWSSPVGVYTEDGKGYIVVCDAAGRMYLIRGTSGETLDSIQLGSNVEASPAVYGNMIVVGTRGNAIFGIKMT